MASKINRRNSQLIRQHGGKCRKRPPRPADTVEHEHFTSAPGFQFEHMDGNTVAGRQFLNGHVKSFTGGAAEAADCAVAHVVTYSPKLSRLDFMRIHRLTAFQVPIDLKEARAACVARASGQRNAYPAPRDGRRELRLGRRAAAGLCDGRNNGFRLAASGTDPDFSALAMPHFPVPPMPASRSTTFAWQTSRLIRASKFANALATQPDALELAILDAACHAQEISLGDFIQQHPAAIDFATPCDEVFYSGAVTSMTPRRQWISVLKMRLFAFRQVKLKVGTDGISDVDLLRRVRRIVGRTVDLRLDANEAWHCDDVASRLNH